VLTSAPGVADAGARHAPTGDYRNPVIGPDAPDPYILRIGDLYYAYSSSSGTLHIPMRTSRDLATWSAPSDSLPNAAAWAAGSLFYWSPGVLAEHGRFVLYYAAMHQLKTGQACISAAVASSPAGPFVDTSTAPMVCQDNLGGSIDPSPFVDDDGAAWLVWKSDGDSATCGCPSSLWSQRLTPDRMGVTGPRHRLLTVAEPWEQPLIEGPELHRVRRVYYLLYAGNWWDTARYAIGLATCASPAGPCTRLSVAAPFVHSARGASGPGGPVTFAAFGRRWLGYHAWITGAVATPGSGRATRIDVLDLDGRGLPSSGAPTTSARPLRAHVRG
jgi:beta-xylosidase